LRSIRLLSDILTDYLTDDQQAETIILEIQNNADQAQSMIKSLRDFSRLGTSGLQLESVNLKSVADGCINRLAVELEKAKAEIEVSEMGNALTDRTLLSQVFSNLIENALKYSARSDLKIRISAEQITDNGLLVSVCDNGVGIDERYAERIFELFRRVPGSHENSEGDGVGLATCRKLVECLGGRDLAGHDIPVRRPVLLHPAGNGLDAEEENMKNAFLLLVDDSDLDARLMTMALQQSYPELTVQRAHDGETGLDALESLTPDMVVLDISMPGLDRFQVLDRIRENERTSAMPVVMCSNSDSPQDVLRSYRKHANSYVQKPDSRAGYDALASSLTQFWFDQAELPE